MKFNWGTGVIVAFVLFISFIMYFVISMNTNKKYDHDLVTEEYYQQELEYQNDIDKEKKATGLKENIQWKKSDNGIVIIFPNDLDFKEVSGKVFLYRPSNKQLDFETAISLSDYNLLIPDKRLLDGRWNIKVDWQYNGKSYLYKKEILY